MTLFSKPASSKVALSAVKGFGGNAVMRVPGDDPGRLAAMNLHEVKGSSASQSRAFSVTNEKRLRLSTRIQDLGGHSQHDTGYCNRKVSKYTAKGLEPLH